MNYFRIFMASMLMLPLSMFAGDSQTPLLVNDSSQAKFWTRKKMIGLGVLGILAGTGTIAGILAYGASSKSTPSPAPVPSPYPDPEIGEGCFEVSVEACNGKRCFWYTFSPACVLYNSSSPELQGCPSYISSMVTRPSSKEECDRRLVPHRCYSEAQVAEIFPTWCKAIPLGPKMQTSQPALPNSTTKESMQSPTARQNLRAKIKRFENARRAR